MPPVRWPSKPLKSGVVHERDFVLRQEQHHADGECAMTWEAIQAQASISAIGAVPREMAMPSVLGISAQPTNGVDFGQLVSSGIAEVNQQLVASQVDLQRLATGDVQNLHQVMMGLEETRLSFQLLLQVRNRMLEAYQDVMKMQV